jgi:acyl-CoA thioester hydrolase
MIVETARGTVHEWQRDHMGHINVRAYMEFFDAACWQFYAMLGLTASLLRSGAVNLAAVQQNISYTKELYPGDTVCDCELAELFFPSGKMELLVH